MSKYIDEKTKRLLIGLGAVVGLILLIIIIILIVNAAKPKTLSYTGIEDKMVEASKLYYSKKNEALPVNEGEEVEVSASTLSEEGYMKDISKYQEDKNASCSGSVIVTKSGEGYDYAPRLDCGDKYSTKFLYEKLLGSVVSKDDGLYKTTEYSSKGTVNTYVFKGDFVDNYVNLNGRVWRIVKMDSKFNITLIESDYDRNVDYKGSWDNRYNVQRGTDVGINDYYKSVIRRSLGQEVYDKLDNNTKAKLVMKDLCIGKRSTTETKNDGSVECSNTLSNEYLSLLTAYDFMNASLDTNCKTIIDKSCGNYNYLVAYNRSFWLLTPNSENTYGGYKVSDHAATSNLSTSAIARLVINVNKNLVCVSGSGTEADPYIVK